MYIDNMSAINMINHRIPTERSRHIDIQHFAIQDWRENGDIETHHIEGILCPPDCLTKPVGWILHARHAHRIMGHYDDTFYEPKGYSALPTIEESPTLTDCNNNMKTNNDSTPSPPLEPSRVASADDHRLHDDRGRVLSNSTADTDTLRKANRLTNRPTKRSTDRQQRKAKMTTIV